MSIIDTSRAEIGIRSYGKQETSDRHGFVQLVLPLSGEVHLGIETSQKLLSPLHAAVVPAGAWHSQYGVGDNRSLILDVEQTVFMHSTWDRLTEMRFTEIGAATRKLIEFMQISLETGTVGPAHLQGWIPLLFDTMVQGTPQAQSRLAALLSQIEANPSLTWTTETMSRFARMSVSRLHALFQEELNTSPHAWLLQKRLELVCELLARTNRPIADIALSTGFADQSVLTRAMRQNLDITPAAYRRRQRETKQKTQ